MGIYLRDAPALWHVSVLISHVAWAHGGVDTMVRHTNAGASDLDRATIGLSERTLALKTPYT